MNSHWTYSPERDKLGFDLCDLDHWPWPFAWTSLLSLAITAENFMMTWWWEHSEKKVWQTDGRTDRSVIRAAWSLLKIRDGTRDLPITLAHWSLSHALFLCWCRYDINKYGRGLYFDILFEAKLWPFACTMILARPNTPSEWNYDIFGCKSIIYARYAGRNKQLLKHITSPC